MIGLDRADSKRLGNFEILRELGRGGMGVVHLARDVKLDRQVAIKVLPEAFVRDAQRVARFEQEAKVLAALNHPNIATLYGFEEADGVRYLVLEYVPGRTLAECLAAGALPTDDALNICRQIAEGLEAAHESGIIHRDLKPGNVMVTPDGKAKLLDFGLAKALTATPSSSELQHAETITTPAKTREGVILGTTAYMSPEQARGKPMDRRTDIWSFGCVMYETLTGGRAFKGETISDTIASVLHHQPDLDALPADTPATTKLLIRRCLQKDTSRRLQHIGDARIDLEEASSESYSAELRPPSPSPGRRANRWRQGVPWLVAAAMTVVAAVVGLRRIGPAAPASNSPVRLTISLPPSAPVALARSMPLGVGRVSLALSPDGRTLVYVAKVDEETLLYVRRLDDFAAEPIPGTEGAFHPFFSPDGSSIGFFTATQLKRIGIRGGQPVALCEARNPFGAAWLADDTIVLANLWGTEYLKVSAKGGAPPIVVGGFDKGPNSVWRDWPEAIPDSTAALYGAKSGYIGLIDVATGQESRIMSAPQRARAAFAASGHIVYGRSGMLEAVPFDISSRTLTGDPATVLRGVRAEQFGATQFAISRNGTLAYITGTDLTEATLVWVNRKGEVEEEAWRGRRRYGTFKVSPDGTEVAVVVNDTRPQMWVYDFERNIPTRLSVTGEYFAWRDADRLVLTSPEAGVTHLLSISVRGVGERETLFRSDHGLENLCWHPHEDVLIFAQYDPSRKGKIWVMPVGRSPEEFVATPETAGHPVFSPNGKWVAYHSTASGQEEVYVAGYPDAEPLWQVSRDGGEEPIWSRKGDELFYRNGRKWMVVPTTMNDSPGSNPGAPELLFEGDYMNVPGHSYDVAPDGRFLMLKGRDDETPVTEIRVVLNWFDELKRLAPPSAD